MRHRSLFILAMLLLPTTAVAGTYNYRLTMPGERAAGFAGAYTALSNTAEGGFYNPAGLASIQFDTFSVSGNIYSLTRGKRKNALVFSGESTDLPQDSFTSIPQIATAAKRFRMPWQSDDQKPRAAFALNVVVSDQTELAGRIDGDIAGGNVIADRTFSDTTLWVGPSIAYSLRENFSIGGSIFYRLRDIDWIGFVLQQNDAVSAQSFAHVQQTVGALVGKIGTRYTPLEKWWLGLAYTTKPLKVHSDGFIFESVKAENLTNNTTSGSLIDEENLKSNAETPHQIDFGIAYEDPGRFAVAGDLLIFFPNSYLLFNSTENIKVEQDAVFNFSVGGEYYFGKNLVARGGFFTDFSAAPASPQGVLDQLDEIDIYGFSTTISLEQENSSITAGTTISFGNGSGVNNLGGTADVVRQTYQLILAGSFRF